VQARTGERFNLGEVTVTRCALRLPAASAASGHTVGVAYVLGSLAPQGPPRRCGPDALLQDPAHHDALNDQLLQPVRRHLALHSATAPRQSTKHQGGILHRGP